MNKYKIGEQVYVVIDNQLFQPVEPFSDVVVSLPVVTSPGKKYIPQVKKRGKGMKLTPEQIESLVQDRANGMGFPKLEQKYGVSNATIYNMLRKYGKKKKADLGQRTTYQCENKHTFISNLPKLDAVCPTCGSLEVNEALPAEVIEEDN